MDVGTGQHRLHLALLAQGYARVAVEHLTPTGDIELSAPNVPAELDKALRSAIDYTNWRAIGERFALLKETPGGHFDNLYLRANEHVLHLAVVGRFGTAPLAPTWLRSAFSASWPIVENIDDLLETFPLPAALQTTGQQLVTAYLGAADPLTQAAASLLNAALVARVVNAGPLAAYIAICEAGVTSEVRAEVDGWKFFEKKAKLAMHPPYMAGYLWDTMTNQVHGHDEQGGGTLSPTQLRQSLGAG